MAATIREQIITALLAKLALVTVAAGYNSDCGQTVKREQRKLDPEKNELPCFVVWPGPETAVEQYGYSDCTMTVGIEAHALIGTNDPSQLKELLLGDTIKALCKPAKRADTLAGLAQKIIYSGGGSAAPVEPGDASVGISTLFTVRYRFKAGDPYSQ